MTKIKELRQKNRKELNDLLADSRKKVSQLRFDLASKKLKNVRKIKELKKDIARLLTILGKKKHEAGRKK